LCLCSTQVTDGRILFFSCSQKSQDQQWQYSLWPCSSSTRPAHRWQALAQSWWAWGGAGGVEPDVASTFSPPEAHTAPRASVAQEPVSATNGSSGTLELGADPTFLSRGLFQAITAGNLTKVRQWLELGTAADTVDPEDPGDGETALMRAAAYDRDRVGGLVS